MKKILLLLVTVLPLALSMDVGLKDFKADRKWIQSVLDEGVNVNDLGIFIFRKLKHEPLLKAMRILLASDAYCDSKNRHDNPLIEEALVCHNTDVALLCDERKLTFSDAFKDSLGISCLYETIVNNNKELVRLLLMQGVNPNALDPNALNYQAETSLYCAILVCSGYFDIIKLLLHAGAEVSDQVLALVEEQKAKCLLTDRANPQLYDIYLSIEKLLTRYLEHCKTNYTRVSKSTIASTPLAAVALIFQSAVPTVELPQEILAIIQSYL
jgi:hypothetical protein